MATVVTCPSERGKAVGEAAWDLSWGAWDCQVDVLCPGDVKGGRG